MSLHGYARESFNADARPNVRRDAHRVSSYYTAQSPAKTAPPHPDAAAAQLKVGRRLLALAGAGSIAMVVLVQVANVLNYASNLAFSRILEPAGFGELTALLAFALVLAVPLGAAQTVVAERIALAHAAGDEDRVRYLVRLALGHVATLGAVVGVLYVAAIPLTQEVLGIRQPGPVIALAPFVVANFAQTVALGALQGTERFAAFGWVVFAAAASRLAFGIPWALGGGGAGGAIAGQALGLIVVLTIVGWSSRHWLLRRGTGAATRGLRRRPDLQTLTATGAYIGFAVLANLDLVLARVWLDSTDAGLYAALSTVAKLVIFLPAALAMLMVPSTARARASGRERVVLRRTARLVALSAALVVIPSVLAPGLLLDLMFGDDYVAARSGVLPSALAGAALSLLFVVCTYSVTVRDSRWMALLVGGVGLQAVLIALFHESPAQVAAMQAIACGAVLLANEAVFHSLVREWRR
jgi:O-antigen/teichoic acid export membrane protein